MKKLIKIGLFVATLFCVLCMWAVRLEVRADGSEVLRFSMQIYELALEREFDEGNMPAWFSQMITEDLDCAAITSRIIRSVDFVNIGLDNRAYITRLYRTILGREPEPEERQNWINTMRMGKTRDFVLQKFVNSEYFTELADLFELERGALHEDGRAVNIGVCRFINRLYQVVLERKYDTWGYCTWALMVSDYNCSMEELARAFFDTEKYLSRNTTDEEYVEHLYNVFFNRVADAEEVDAWCELLDADSTRDEVLLCFSRSDEFAVWLEIFGQPPLVPLE